ncbi:hypothetical protein SK128_016281 [Halocaridina rubra]|uniref:Uncharacterized protein n=1 Tax=Halocaridina rubra TaxID=373956 RepID=A0AAN8XIS7_HALRR
MRIIVCVLLVAGVASAQIVRGTTVSSSRPTAASAPAGDNTIAADPAAAAAPAQTSGGAGTGAGAGAAGGAAAAGGGFGPAFFGPGLNNPLALPPNPLFVQRAQQVAASNPNIRVFVDVDGTVEFTDQFGREVEVVDQFGFEALEPIEPQEQQKLLLQSRQQEFQLRRQQLEQQLLSEFGLAQGGQAFATGTQGAGAQAQGLQRNFRIAI